MEDTDEPYTMRLAKEGVESEVAYEAAAEAERQRLKAERQRMEAKSPVQAIAEEADITQLAIVIVKLLANGRQPQPQGQRQQPVRVERQPEHQPKPVEDVSSPLRETVGDEIDNADES